MPEITNRIRELRKSREWSMEKLAELIDGSTSTVNRLENGDTDLISSWLPKLSAAFGVPWTDIVSIENNDEPVGLAEDATPFEAAKDHPLANVNLGPNRDLWEVKSHALTAIGIEPGDLIIVDISQRAVDSVRMGDAVVVQRCGKSEPGVTATYLRQYIEPDLFTTNSRSRNEMPLSKRMDNVQVKGKIMHKVAPIGGGPH